MPRAKEYDSDSLRLSSAVNVGLSAFLWHKLGMAQVVFDSLNLTVHWNRTLLVLINIAVLLSHIQFMVAAIGSSDSHQTLQDFAGIDSTSFVLEADGAIRF